MTLGLVVGARLSRFYHSVKSVSINMLSLKIDWKAYEMQERSWIHQTGSEYWAIVPTYLLVCIHGYSM